VDKFYNDNIKEKRNEDYYFPNHLAWRGRPQLLPDRLRVFAVNAIAKAGGLALHLTEALTYPTLGPGDEPARTSSARRSATSRRQQDQPAGHGKCCTRRPTY